MNNHHVNLIHKINNNLFSHIQFTQLHHEENIKKKSESF